MKQLVILAFALLTFSALAQPAVKHTLTSVYFRTDKYDLQPKEKRSLDTLLKFLSGKELVSVLVKGNTDSDADSLYNIELSKNRTNTVKAYLEDRIKGTSIKTDYFGENKPIATNANDGGKQQNRRVDVIVRYKDKSTGGIVVKMRTEPMPPEPVPYKDTCDYDTMIYLPQGSRFSMNVCDYKKYKDCISIKEYTTPESIAESDMGTESADGHQLITGGMFEIKICDDPPLRKPMSLLVPVSENLRNPELAECDDTSIDFRQMQLWTGRSNGTWDDAKDVEIVDSNDAMYYLATIQTGGRYNYDIRPPKTPQLPRMVKTKFKSKGEIRLVKVRLVYARVPTVYEGKSTGKRPHIVKVKRIRCGTGDCGGGYCTVVHAVGINDAGDTLKMIKCTSDLKKRELFGGCRRGGIVLVNGFIPARPKIFYRKYIIRPSDWQNETAVMSNR